MTNELASTVLIVAHQYMRSRRQLPPHVITELHDIVASDDVAVSLKSDARSLLWRSAPTHSPEVT